MRRADLAHQLDRTHVDPELQRRGGHQRPQLAGAQAALDPLTALARQRSVMRRDQLLTQPLAQLMRHPLGQLPGVDEHQRGSVLGDVAGDPVEDLVELIAGERRLELAVGQLERHLQPAPVPDVDDLWNRLVGSDQQAAPPLRPA